MSDKYGKTKCIRWNDRQEHFKHSVGQSVERSLVEYMIFTQVQISGIII